MRSILLFLTFLVLAGCNRGTPLRGTVSVEQSLSLVDKAGRLTSISPGYYQAELEIKPRKSEVELKLKREEWDREFDFYLPVNHIPEDGDFFFDGQDIGQPHDIEWTNRARVEVVDSAYERRKCYRYSSRKGRRSGIRTAKYRTEKVTLTTEFKILSSHDISTDTSALTPFATFSGTGHYTKRTESWIGPCRLIPRTPVDEEAGIL